ncbi:hypothetical protein LSH36_399g07035 [Paralvinella palmiformis]|uniref:Uncharacterized protein n=1 Tax=Paralvinella palmiformis TaxID=53620 RepID=A0AAD9JCF3_9ANNE|nr:hypothetical protein LSH36_399g07035 [Paralvinella palmiformis]
MVIWQANQSGVASTIAINGRVSGNKRHRYSVMKDRNKQKHHLVIEEAGLDDEGTFMCEVFGSNPVSQQHSLIVNGLFYPSFPVPASVTVSPPGFLAVTVGDPIELTCNAEGKPNPKVTWSKTGGDISHHDAPSVEVEESIVYTEVGRTSRVNIVCNFDAVPPVEVIWRHNQSRINFKERGRLTESHTHEGVYIMEIRSLLPEDLGEYECVGGNNQGQAIGVISIRAEPYDLQIESELEGLYSDQYRLEWAVISHNPLIEFDLKIQEVNDTHNASWLSSTIPAPRHHILHHKQHYDISELKPSTQYRVKLRARNTYGYSEWIEFEFNTNEGDDNDLAAYTVVISPYHGAAGKMDFIAIYV